MHRRTMIAAAAGILAFGLAPQASAADGPMEFEPISGSAYGQLTASWIEPFVVPDNCTQSRVSDETVLDIYSGVDDLTDMNTVNETGPQAGRFCTAPTRWALMGRCRWSTCRPATPRFLSKTPATGASTG